MNWFRFAEHCLFLLFGGLAGALAMVDIIWLSFVVVGIACLASVQYSGIDCR